MMPGPAGALAPANSTPARPSAPMEKEMIQCVRDCLGQYAAKHWRKCLLGVLAVASGVKSLLLFDTTAASADEVAAFIRRLSNLQGWPASLRWSDVRVLSLGEHAACVAHWPLLMARMKVPPGTTAEPYPLLLDVSISSLSPQMVDQASATCRGVLAMWEDVRAQLCAADDDPQGANGGTATESSRGIPVVEIAVQPEWNLSTLVGWLLEYPAVYWYEREENGAGANCLAKAPLSVYSYSSECRLPGLAGTAATLYSFSVPREMEEKAQLPVAWAAMLQGFGDTLRRRLQEGPAQCIWEPLREGNEVRTLSQVAL